MGSDFLFETPSWLLCGILLVVLAVAIELGFRIGLQRQKQHDGALAGAGTMETAVFGLFGLLLALTFSFVVSRGDDRRRLVLEETNAIGTAYLRCDIAPDPLRAELRTKIRAYVDQRVRHAEAGLDPVQIADSAQRAGALQSEIWSAAAALVRARPDADAYALLLEALNQMFDMQTARDAVLQAHLPPAILLFLALTATVTATVAGYTLGLAGERHGTATVGFVLLTVLVLFVIVDMDRPRRGLFRAPTGLLVKLQTEMKEGPP